MTVYQLSGILLKKMAFKKKSIVLESQVLPFVGVFAIPLEILSLQIQDTGNAIL